MARSSLAAAASAVLALTVAAALAGPATASRRTRGRRQAVHAGDVTFTPSQAQHVVEPGDTLWALCERFTGKPWVWPKVWAMNPELTNPHWLFPGDLVRFVPDESGARPARAELLASAVDEAPAAAAPAHGARGRYGVEEVDGGAAALGPRRLHQRVFNGLFITPEELAAAGSLAHAAPDKLLLRPGDTVFLRAAKGAPMRPGQRFMTFRTRRAVAHPITGRPSGYMTEVTGVATVESVEGNVARARLEATLMEVERGQRVAPLLPHLLDDVRQVDNGAKVAGVILATEADPVAVGEEKLVFVDRGQSHGLARGHTLTVHSRGDELTGDQRGLPNIDIATLLVVEAKEAVSTCLVVDAQREIWPGDPVATAAAGP